MARLAQMQYLLVTNDRRLSRALMAEVEAATAVGMEGVVQFQVVADAAGAIRSATSIAPDGCLLDGGLSAAIFAECWAWWRRSAWQHGRLLAIEPRPGAVEEGEGQGELEFLARAAAVILQAVRRAPGFRLDVARQRLSGSEVVVDLTASEAALLACLGRAAEGMTAHGILAAAFRRNADPYVTESTGLIRTHLANIRRKCRAAGMDEVVRTVGRRYEAPSLIVSTSIDNFR
jgi:hypothetical protein